MPGITRRRMEEFRKHYMHAHPNFFIISIRSPLSATGMFITTFSFSSAQNEYPSSGSLSSVNGIVSSESI